MLVGSEGWWGVEVGGMGGCVRWGLHAASWSLARVGYKNKLMTQGVVG